jgi:hypothetical protein
MQGIAYRVARTYGVQKSVLLLLLEYQSAASVSSFFFQERDDLCQVNGAKSFRIEFIFWEVDRPERAPQRVDSMAPSVMPRPAP